MLEYNFSKKPVNDEVKVEYNKNIVKKGEKLSEDEIARRKKEYYEENKKAMIGRNDVSKLGLESSLGKDDRIFQLREGVTSGKYVTVTSASKGMSLSRATIIKYAKEGNITILDDKKGEWING